MRITKTTAQEVSNLMVAHKKEKINTLQEAFEKKVTEYYLKSIPNDVKSFYIRHPQFTRVNGIISLLGNGFNFEQVCGGNVPNGSDSGYPTFKPNKTEAKVLIKLQNDCQVLKDQTNKLQSDIKAALISLGTYKKVEAEFPEAFRHLPVKMSTALVVPINSITKRLK